MLRTSPGIALPCFWPFLGENCWHMVSGSGMPWVSVWVLVIAMRVVHNLIARASYVWECGCVLDHVARVSGL